MNIDFCYQTISKPRQSRQDKGHSRFTSHRLRAKEDRSKILSEQPQLNSAAISRQAKRKFSENSEESEQTSPNEITQPIQPIEIIWLPSNY